MFRLSYWIPSEWAWIASQLASTLGFFLAFLLLAHLLRQKRSPVSTTAWLLVIFLLPYVGVPLYLMLGGRKLLSMARHKPRVYNPRGAVAPHHLDGTAERLLESYGVPPARSGNRVRLIGDGEDAYRSVLEFIDKAERSIHITTYILGRDDVGREIVARLVRRAKDGVEVRLLLDSVGCWRVSRRFLAPLTAAGAKVAFFMPMFRLPHRGRANLRNHRKLIVTDDRQALAGGMNLAGEYMGPTADAKRWLDLSLVVEGPAVHDLAELFASDWKFATSEDLSPPKLPPATAVPSEGTIVQVVASGPDVTGDPLYDSLVTAFFGARARIWAVTPYFVPDETLVRALELAARRGIDVRLMVPEHSNHLTADLARGSYLNQLQEAGGQVLLFKPVMLHAKLIILDNDLAVVGSANMDMRSLFLNFELALFLYSREQVAAASAWMEASIKSCRHGITPPGWARELAENVGRLMSPLL
ncbi:MAG: phospholipase D-like domain-containing protein [Isosphaeraceae bacterium]|nr:phospholipase D-like domain-containing protein [Isosphaeraceae bacterium]